MTLQLTEKPTLDRCVTLHGVSWEQFETIESALEGIAGVRLTYLDGTLDIMTPLSPEHEDSKSTISLLLEAYLREKGIRLLRSRRSHLGEPSCRGKRRTRSVLQLGNQESRS